MPRFLSWRSSNIIGASLVVVLYFGIEHRELRVSSCIEKHGEQRSMNRTFRKGGNLNRAAKCLPHWNPRKKNKKKTTTNRTSTVWEKLGPSQRERIFWEGEGGQLVGWTVGQWIQFLGWLGSALGTTQRKKKGRGSLQETTTQFDPLFHVWLPERGLNPNP